MGFIALACAKGMGLGGNLAMLFIFIYFFVRVRSLASGRFLSTEYFDGDRDVDSNDLTDPQEGWEARFGDDLMGTDFLTWQQHTQASSPALVQGVPEPTSFALLLLPALLPSLGRAARGNR